MYKHFNLWSIKRWLQKVTSCLRGILSDSCHYVCWLITHTNIYSPLSGILECARHKTLYFSDQIRFSMCHDSIKCSWQGFMTLTAGVTWHVSFTIYTGELDIVVTRNSKVDRTFQIYFSTGYWICMLQAINPEMVCTADIYHFCFKDFAKL